MSEQDVLCGAVLNESHWRAYHAPGSPACPYSAMIEPMGNERRKWKREQDPSGNLVANLHEPPGR